MLLCRIFLPLRSILTEFDFGPQRTTPILEKSLHEQIRNLCNEILVSMFPEWEHLTYPKGKFLSQMWVQMVLSS